MSKKNRYHGQLHTSPPQESRRETGTSSFDRALSSALKKMLEADEPRKSVKRDDYPVIQLPTRENPPDDSAKGREKAAPAARRTDSTGRDDALSAFVHTERKERYTRSKAAQTEQPQEREHPLPETQRDAHRGTGEKKHSLSKQTDTEPVTTDTKKLPPVSRKPERKQHRASLEMTQKVRIPQAAEPQKQTDTEPVTLDTKKLPPVSRKPERKQHRASLEMTQDVRIPQAAEPAMPEEPDWLLPDDSGENEDTASLLSAIDALLGSTEQAEELQPEEPQKAVTTEKTVRFTPPNSVPEDAAKTDFWSEFEDLKRLIGTQPTASDAPGAIGESARQADVPEQEHRGEAALPAQGQTEPAGGKKSKDKLPPQPKSKKTDLTEEKKNDREAAKPQPDNRQTQPKKKAEPKDRQTSARAGTLKLPPSPEEPAIAAAAAAKMPEKPSGTAAAPKRVPQGKKTSPAEPAGRQKPVSRPPKAAKKEPTGLHPEEAYRQYTKKLGTTGTRLMIAGIVTAISLFLTVYASTSWSFLPSAFDRRVTAYVLLALLAVTAALAYDVFSDALRKLCTLRFSVPLQVLLASFAVALDTFGAAASDRLPFCTAAGVLIVLLLWDRYDGVTGILTTLRVLRDAKTPTGIVEVHDLMKGRIGLSRAEGSVPDFMERYEQPAPTDKLMKLYTPIAAAISIGASAYIAIRVGTPFFWTASLMLLGSIPFAGILNFNRLFCILAKRLSDSDAALCGWYGAETFGGDHAIFVGDNDLFSQNNIKFNGIKVIAKDADRVIGYAAATAKATGIALYPLFEEELQNRNARRFRADRYRFYESGGVGAEVSGDVVLMGTLDFMRRMGVHMESGMKLRQAVYTSVNGELAAVFAIKYTPKESVRRGLAAISENRHFQTVFTTRDFLLTPDLVRDRYEIALTNIIYPSAKERIHLSEKELKKKGKQGALLADDAFGGFADAVAGGRVLKSAVTAAMILTLLNGLIGLGLMAVLTFRFGFEAATAVNLLLYQLAWLIPTLLLTGWTRRY